MRQLKITQSITNRRESHTLEKYFTEVSGVPMITPEEEVKLAKQIKKGSQRALDRLVKANLRFVVSVAKQYQNRSLPLNDLINEGNLGLIKAQVFLHLMHITHKERLIIDLNPWLHHRHKILENMPIHPTQRLKDHLL